MWSIDLLLEVEHLLNYMFTNTTFSLASTVLYGRELGRLGVEVRHIKFLHEHVLKKLTYGGDSVMEFKTTLLNQLNSEETDKAGKAELKEEWAFLKDLMNQPGILHEYSLPLVITAVCGGGHIVESILRVTNEDRRDNAN